VRFDQVSPTSSRLATLPNYPFQRQRYWFDPAPRARRDDDASPARATGTHPLLGRAVPLASPSGAVVWENRVTFATDPFVPEHGFQGSVVFNSFAYLEAALAAARVSAPQGGLRVDDAEFRKVMFVPEDGAREVQWHVVPDGAGFSFRAYGRDAGDAGATWVLHAVARVSRDETGGERTDLAALRTRCGSTMAGEEVYAGLETFGTNLGPRFRGLVRAHMGDGEALGEIVTPEGLADESGPYAFHPALLDACAHTLVTASPEQRAFMPVKIGSTRVFRRPPRVLWSHARVSSPSADTGEAGLCGDVRVYDSDGAPVAEVLGIELRYLDRVQAPAARPSRPRRRADGDRVAVALMAPEARAARVREYLAAAVADVLRLESPVSDAGAALDAMGLDSLMAVELKRRIAADLGASVPIVSFLRHASLTQLGDIVLGVLDSAEPTQPGMFTVVDASASLRDSADASRPALDLTSEVVLDDAVRVKPGLRAPQGPPEQPLLTGVTGYLGAFLLVDLLRAGAGEVRCLVRASDVAAGRERIQRTLARRGLWEPSFAGRVVPVTGDLAKPRLGLAPREFDALADAVDAVYHSGALVNFLFPYEDVRATNVDGTAEILRLATRGAVKPVHFVSSLSVFFTAQYAGVTVSESETPEHAEHLPLQGYAQSKWVADRLISLARERGIPATTYRPVFIGWHSRTGEYNPDDFLCRFIQACVMLGAAPEIDMDLMIAPVDYVSAATVALSRRADAAGKNYHLTHAVRVTWSDLLEWLGETRHRVARVPYASWRERLVAAAASESGKGALRTLVPLFPPVEMDASVTELMSARRAPVFDSAATRTDLAPSGIACPAMDAALLGVFVEKLARNLEDRRVSGADGAPARLPRYARGSLSAPLTHRADVATGPLAPLAPLGGSLTAGDELAQAADFDRGENFG
jgi:thioester reductase-like protein